VRLRQPRRLHHRGEPVCRCAQLVKREGERAGVGAGAARGGVRTGQVMRWWLESARSVPGVEGCLLCRCRHRKGLKSLGWRLNGGGAARAGRRPISAPARSRGGSRLAVLPGTPGAALAGRWCGVSAAGARAHPQRRLHSRTHRCIEPCHAAARVTGMRHTAGACCTPCFRGRAMRDAVHVDKRL